MFDCSKVINNKHFLIFFVLSFQMWEQKMVFVLGDVLPMNYDAAIALFSVCQMLESDKTKYCISSYVSALIDMWIKAFGKAHVQDQKAITEKIKRVITQYKTHVYNEKNQTKPKKKGTL